MESIVTLHEGTPVVSSEVIAEAVELKHKDVIALIRKYQADLEEFGTFAFETRKSGGLPTTFALLNEPQATLLLTYMRNNSIVRSFKKRLVMAFYEMAVELRGRRRQKRLTYRPVTPRQMRNLQEDVRAIVAHRRDARAWTKAFWERCRKECGFEQGAPLPTAMIDKAWLLNGEFERMVKEIDRIERGFAKGHQILFSGRRDAVELVRFEHSLDERLAGLRYGDPHPRLAQAGFQMDLFQPE